jgi:carboxyl-terminal processing protease
MRSQTASKRIREIALIIVLCLVWFLIGWLARGWLLAPDANLVEEARQNLKNVYPSDVPNDRELTYAAIRGMLDRIEDPYAQLMDPAVGRAYLTDFAGTSGAVGVSPVKRNGHIVVDQVFPGQAADRAGLKSGDVILSVNGVSFDEDMTEAQAAMLHIAGPVGTIAHFVVQRGSDILNLDVPRQDKTLVVSRMLDDEVGYLFLSAFTQNAPLKFSPALRDLLQQHPKALILDLRDNRGGSMEAAQQIVSDFIEEGLLFTVELKGATQKQFLAQGDAVAPDIPLVVLVNKETYSSAEAAAAAIQERERGKLIGAQTHGKAEVQTTVPLGDGSLLHYTIGKILSPMNHWYQGRGLTPDVVVNDERNGQSDAILESALSYLRQHLTQ